MNRKLLAACVGFILAVIVVATFSMLPSCEKPETFRDTVEVIDASRTEEVNRIGERLWTFTVYEAVVIYKNQIYKIEDENSYYAAKMHLNQPAEAIIEVRGDKVRVKEVLP